MDSSGAEHGATVTTLSLVSASRTHTLCYALLALPDGTFLSTIDLNGRRIGSRRFSSRSEALRVGPSLLEQFIAAGWTVVSGLPTTAVH
jgi:hypothetical protein